MLITIIAFVAILSIIVFVHELGHFSTARFFGAKVEEFGLGLPPRIFGVKKEDNKFKVVGPKHEDPEGQTIYSVNWIPIGGFVKIRGENGEDPDDPKSFANKKIWQRVIMISAGVIMNFVLCAVILIIGFMVGIPAVVEGDTNGAIVSEPTIQIVEIVENTVAADAGIVVGDIILSVDSVEYSSSEELHDYLVSKLDSNIILDLKRGDEIISKDLLVSQYSEDNIGIGVGLVETALVRYPWYLAIWQGIRASFIWLVAIVLAFATIIKNLIIGVPTGVEVAGPVGIAVLTGQATKMGIIYLMQFTALLSLNLAIINILPFPALDGGRLVFLLVEKIRGKAVQQKWENLVHNIGFILLMTLVVFVTYKDVVKYGGKIWGVIIKSIGF